VFPQHPAAQALPLTSVVHGDEAGLPTDTQGLWRCLPCPLQLLPCLHAAGQFANIYIALQFKLCDLVEEMYPILNALSSLS